MSFRSFFGTIVPMKYLGIDYGTKRVGLAISDENNKIAFPSAVIQNDSKILQNLKKILNENKIKKVIIGESQNYKMEDNEIMREILDLKEIIEKTMEKDVILHPEFMSSAQAEKIQGKNKMIDASAAAIILQSYLDQENNK